ncbi:MAG: NADH-quinone oxidoreductase subunit A [Acidobacteria bacterium]|nr:MAG: NADH-quinone oxidoreductase subunit A [Acidobacteriota bacterium]
MLWPLVVYFVLVILLMVAMLSLSYLLGGRHRQHATALPYEGGVPSTGGAQVRLSARFYLVAMFFVVFDLESAFIFSWAVVARDAGWFGYAEIATFIVILLLTLWYLARIGALEWNELLRPARTRSFGSKPPEVNI